MVGFENTRNSFLVSAALGRFRNPFICSFLWLEGFPTSDTSACSCVASCWEQVVWSAPSILKKAHKTGSAFLNSLRGFAYAYMQNYVYIIYFFFLKLGCHIASYKQNSSLKGLRLILEPAMNFLQMEAYLNSFCARRCGQKRTWLLKSLSTAAFNQSLLHSRSKRGPCRGCGPVTWKHSSKCKTRVAVVTWE